MNNWRKSSYSFSNGNCAEVAAWRKSTASAGGNCAGAAGRWRKSSHSGEESCAEVGQDGTVVAVRDSQDPDGPVLAFSAQAWTGFTARLRSA